MQTTTSGETARTIGELCIGADWACANDDLPALEAIACQLAAYTPEPLHCELARLAELCRSDRTRATDAWSRLKDRVYRSAS
jgi:hypothetical protein